MVNFQNEIATQLIIVDNNGNRVIIIGPGPSIVVHGQNGSIVLDGTGLLPTQYFYNSDASNYAFLNLGHTTPPFADLGINNGQYAGNFYATLQERARIFFQSPGNESHVGTIRVDTQAQVGGNLTWTDSQMAMTVKDATGNMLGQLLLQQGNAPGGADNVNAFLQAGNLSQSNIMSMQAAQTNFSKPIVRTNQECIVQFPAAGFALAANADTFAQGGWSEITSSGWFSVVGGFAQIVVPYSTYYEITFWCNGNPNNANTFASYVTAQARNINQSVARDARDGPTTGGDGATCLAYRRVLLSAGVVLFWGNWCSQAITACRADFGRPTELSVRAAG